MSTNAQATHRRGQSPITLFLIGALSIVLWLIATLLQIETSEAWMIGGAQVTINSISWDVLLQPWTFLFGHLTMPIQAVMWGWGIEIVTLWFAIAAEIAIHAVSASHARMSKVFFSVGLILMALNGYSDFNYGTLSSGWLGHFGFSVITSGLVVWGLVIGIRFIEKAFAVYGGH